MSGCWPVRASRKTNPRSAKSTQATMSMGPASTGHCIPIVYAALARIGMIPNDWLGTLRKFGSPLQGHPDRIRCPGIEAATGSLGQGLSIALGLALAAEHDGSPWRTYCMMGDGEQQSGHIWEAAMLAGGRGVGNLVGILDNNQVQQS